MSSLSSSLSRYRILIAAAALGVVFFTLDVYLHLGVAAGVNYILVVWVASLSKYRKAIYGSAVICSLLVALGFFVSPEGGEPWQVITNRSLCVLAIAVTAFFTHRLTKTERLNQQLEQRFQNVIESAPVAMIMVDRHGKIVLTNTEAEILFRYSRDELLRLFIDELVPGRFKSVHGDHRRSFFVRPEARRMGMGRDLFARRKDGSEFPVEIGLNPVQMEDGLFVLSTIADITQRKRIEQRTEAVIESAPIAIVMTDYHGGIVLVNHEAEKLFQYSRQEIKGQSVETLLPERFRSMHKDHRRKFLIRPESRSMGVGHDLFARRKDGSEFPVEIGLNPVGTEDGLFVLSVIADITERMRMEEERRLASEEIHRINEALKRSNEELEVFASAASHDLKAPLRAILHIVGWIEEDAAGTLSAASLEHLEKLRQRAARMDDLLDDLLAYSRIGHITHEAELIEVNKLIEDVTLLLDPPPGFSITSLGELPVFRAEKTPLQLVFRNLIGNAIKHHENEKGHVWVSASENGRLISFKIEDDGPGIDPQYHERIFNLFTTLKPKEKTESSGMGLAMVKKTIEKHEGTICVESQVGQGTAFTFTWPKAE